MNRKSLIFTAAAAMVTSLTIQAAEPDISKLPAPSDKKVEFAKDVKPVLEQNCVRCHGPEKQKSKYRLDRREDAIKGGSSKEAAIVVGKSDKSPLIHFVAGLVEDMDMPPKDDEKSKPLTKDQIGVLRAWIDQGAKWE